MHKAAKTLGIKYSTAKAIVKRFKETGILSARLKTPEDRPIDPIEESPSNVEVSIE